MRCCDSISPFFPVGLIQPTEVSGGSLPPPGDGLRFNQALTLLSPSRVAGVWSAATRQLVCQCLQSVSRSLRDLECTPTLFSDHFSVEYLSPCRLWRTPHAGLKFFLLNSYQHIPIC